MASKIEKTFKNKSVKYCQRKTIIHITECDYCYIIQFEHYLPLNRNICKTFKTNSYELLYFKYCKKHII